MLKAEAEAQRALTRLADTRAECNEQHQAITAEPEAIQTSVKESLRAATQQTTVQAAKVDALGYRLEEMKDLLLQRELRMEVQMAELNNQMHTLRCAPADKQPKAAELIASTSKTVPMRTPNQPITLKTSPKSEPRVSKPPPTDKKTNKVHVCAPNPLSSVSLPPAPTFTRTQNRAVDPMTTTSSIVDLPRQQLAHAVTAPKTRFIPLPEAEPQVSPRCSSLRVRESPLVTLAPVALVRGTT